MKLVTREELIFLLHKACVLFDQASDQTPDWVRAIAGANPPMIESALEVARDIYTLDETGEI
jgi:hypothetical protein